MCTIGTVLKIDCTESKCLSYLCNFLIFLLVKTTKEKTQDLNEIAELLNTFSVTALQFCLRRHDSNFFFATDLSISDLAQLH
jgi:hypothetical protein